MPTAWEFASSDILERIAHRKFYSKVSLQIALNKSRNLPLFIQLKALRAEDPVPEIDYAYDDFRLISKEVPISTLQDVAKNIGAGAVALPEFGIDVKEIDPEYDRFASSGEEWAGVTAEWPSQIYSWRLYRTGSPNWPRENLVKKGLPLFRSGQDAVGEVFGLNYSSEHPPPMNCIIILPDYRAKISSIKLQGPKIKVDIEEGVLHLSDLMLKLYCHRDAERINEWGSSGIPQTRFRKDDVQIKSNPIEFDAGFSPTYLETPVLTSEGDLIDSISFNRSYNPNRKVIFEIPGEEIRELTRQGEGPKLEYKQELSKPHDDFLRTVVAFANTEGGLILIGVTDKGEITGISKELRKEDLDDMIRNRCTPWIETELKTVDVGGDLKVQVVKVSKGNEQPYTFNDQIIVRRGATDRLAKRDEVLELTRKNTYPMVYP